MFQTHGIIMLNASDHNLVSAARKQPKIEKSFMYIWGRSYRNFQNVLFERDVIFEDWSDVTREGDVNVAWRCFAAKLTKIRDKHAPYKHMKVTDSMPKWVTVEYIATCDEHDFHFDEYHKDKTEVKQARMKRSRNYLKLIEK